MKLKSLLPLALLALAVPAHAGQDPGADEGRATADSAGGGEVRVATANPSRIFNAMRETKDLKESLESEGVRLKAVEEEKRAEVQKLQDQRAQLKADTPQWDKLNEDLLVAATEFDTWGKLTKAKAERNQKRQMKQLFAKIEAAIAEIAEREGYDLVVADQRPELPENLDQINFDQLRALINSRNVLYASAKADISDAVITLIDARYKGKGAAAAPRGRPGAGGGGASPRKPAAPRQGDGATGGGGASDASDAGDEPDARGAREGGNGTGAGAGGAREDGQQ